MGRRIDILDAFSMPGRPVSANAMDLLDDASSVGSPTLRVTFDATHSGRLTNMRVYPGARMKRSVSTFMKPTPKPILKHHSNHEDPIGRVSKATYVQIWQGDKFANDFKNPSKGIGSGYIQLVADIKDEDAIPKFMDERFLTFSTSQSSEQAFCSICGVDMLADNKWIWEHEHRPGDTYEIKNSKNSKKTSKHLCYLITGDLKYGEASVVNVPGDDFSAVEGFELIQPKDNSDSQLMICHGDGLTASIEGLALCTKDGGDFVDLFGTVMAKDKRAVTGKTVIAVGPNFDSQFIEETTMVEKEEETPDTEEQTQDTEVNDNKNDDADKTSDGDVDGDAGQEGSTDSGEEGVVAPKPEDGEGSDSADKKVGGLSNVALEASVEALSTKVKTLEDEKSNQSSEIDRLKGQLTEKDEELVRARTTAQDHLAEAKNSMAQRLLDSKLFLKKSDVSDVTDSKTYQTKLEKYAERTQDSLKDALDDLEPEIIEFGQANGKPKAEDLVADKKVDNPVVNLAKDDKTETASTPADLSEKEAANSYFE